MSRFYQQSQYKTSIVNTVHIGFVISMDISVLRF